ncbi:calbindin isoform X2 [Hydra vulgaris]|uniref:Calbindin isoform X2 n=2 Tax=Hydra vulgaris TaxID=6087 RepID=A0ABM4DJU2_HYDVU
MKRKEMEAKKRLDKEKAIIKSFKIPVPFWNGPQFVTSKRFLCSFYKYCFPDKNYVQLSNISAFLNELFSEPMQVIDPNMAATYKKDYLSFLLQKEENLFSMKTIYETLRILEFNFLKRYRGRSKYLLADVLKIWTNYTSSTKIDIMESEELDAFAFDLMGHSFQKYNLHLIKQLSKSLIYLAGCCKEEQINFYGFVKLFIDDKILNMTFPEREKIPRIDFDNGFSYYDQFGNDSVSLNDLDDLLKDVFQQLGLEDSPEAISANRNALLTVITPDKDGKIRRSNIALLLSH